MLGLRSGVTFATCAEGAWEATESVTLRVHRLWCGVPFSTHAESTWEAAEAISFGMLCVGVTYCEARSVTSVANTKVVIFVGLGLWIWNGLQVTASKTHGTWKSTEAVTLRVLWVGLGHGVGLSLTLVDGAVRLPCLRGNGIDGFLGQFTGSAWSAAEGRRVSDAAGVFECIGESPRCTLDGVAGVAGSAAVALLVALELAHVALGAKTRGSWKTAKAIAMCMLLWVEVYDLRGRWCLLMPDVLERMLKVLVVVRVMMLVVFMLVMVLDLWFRQAQLAEDVVNATSLWVGRRNGSGLDGY
jgi:hypothetical protein